MNPWPFVMAAFAIAIGATAWLIVSSMVSMCRAEAEADKLRDNGR